VNSRPFAVLTTCLLVLAAAMSLYVWELRKQASPESAVVPALETTPPGATGAPKEVTLWVAYDNPGILRTRRVSIRLSSERQLQAEQLLGALFRIYTGKDSPHPLPPGAEVRNVYFVDPGVVVIDLSSAVAAGQTSGILPEELTVISILQTLTENTRGIVRAKVLIDGQQRPTLADHADLSTTYDLSQVSALAKQLSLQ
jgi:sporulation and spore germination protein